MDTDYGGFKTTTFDSVVNWSRKFSLFQYPFVTACCGMEYMAAACSHYDISRFGAEIPRFSPRQADVLWVVGTITHKMSPILKNIYDQTIKTEDEVVAFFEGRPVCILICKNIMLKPKRKFNLD